MVTLGHIDIEASAYSLITRMFGCHGSEFTAGEDGEVDDFKIYVNDTRTGVVANLRCACFLYRVSDNALIGKSVEKSGLLSAPGWETFLPDGTINIVNGVDYWVMGWANFSTGGAITGFYASGVNIIGHDSGNYDYGNPPNPLNIDGGPWSPYDMSIYLNYSGVAPPAVGGSTKRHTSLLLTLGILNRKLDSHMLKRFAYV